MLSDASSCTIWVVRVAREELASRSGPGRGLTRAEEEPRAEVDLQRAMRADISHPEHQRKHWEEEAYFCEKIVLRFPWDSSEMTEKPNRVLSFRSPSVPLSTRLSASSSKSSTSSPSVLIWTLSELSARTELRPTPEADRREGLLSLGRVLMDDPECEGSLSLLYSSGRSKSEGSKSG